MADFPDSIPVTEIPRQIVEAEIELLIELLDRLDHDPDLESTADEEPWLGAPAGIFANGFGTNWQGWSAGDDREDDGDDLEPDCDDEDGGDDERELGWTDFQARTGKYHYNWKMQWLVPDGEPSLGSTDRFNQSYWWQGSRDDREEDPDFEEQHDIEDQPFN